MKRKIMPSNIKQNWYGMKNNEFRYESCRAVALTLNCLQYAKKQRGIGNEMKGAEVNYPEYGVWLM
jgi:hypothetical protein